MHPKREVAGPLRPSSPSPSKLTSPPSFLLHGPTVPPVCTDAPSNFLPVPLPFLPVPLPLLLRCSAPGPDRPIFLGPPHFAGLFFALSPGPPAHPEGPIGRGQDWGSFGDSLPDHFLFAKTWGAGAGAPGPGWGLWGRCEGQEPAGRWGRLRRGDPGGGGGDPGAGE